VHSVDDHSPAISLDTAGHVSFFKFKNFIPSITNCLSIVVQKHLEQICGSRSLADSKTSMKYQMSVFNDKSHNLQTRKHDITGSKEYLTFQLVKYSIPPKHSLKIMWKYKQFPWI